MTLPILDKKTCLFQNDFCQIWNVGTLYILKSRSGKYNDQYFQTYDHALKTIGITPDSEKYTFTTK